MSKKHLLRWKERILRQQQRARQATAQQTTLFSLPQTTWNTPDDIDPFTLRQHPADFYRRPEPPEPIDNINQGCLYFIFDMAVPLLLYHGETQLTPTKRWKGVHDCRSYLMRYIELHRAYDLPVAPTSAFWYGIPPNKKILREWERHLIYKFFPPFNKESWSTYGQPFQKSIR